MNKYTTLLEVQVDSYHATGLQPCNRPRNRPHNRPRELENPTAWMLRMPVGPYILRAQVPK